MSEPDNPRRHEPDSPPGLDDTPPPPDVVPHARMSRAVRDRLRKANGEHVEWNVTEVSYDVDGIPNGIGQREENGTLVIPQHVLDYWDAQDADEDGSADNEDPG